MKKLKILFITKQVDNLIGQTSLDFRLEVSKIANITMWHDPGNLGEILSHLDFTPDFIFLNYYSLHCCPSVTGISSVNIPVGLKLGDVHQEVEEHKRYFSETNIRHIFTEYYEESCRRFPEFKDRFLWLPHSVNLDVFRDYGIEKDIDYLLMGCVNYGTYPLRQRILEVMSGEPGFVYHKHPGYNYYLPDTPGVLMRENYSREISRSKIFFTDGSIYRYAVQKYFEAPASKTLLLAQNFSELKNLGFIPGENFVDIDESNFLDKARYYLHHKEEREKITENGYELVRSKHSARIRAQQFIKYAEDILEQAALD